MSRIKRTEPAADYIQPNDFEIKEVARRVGLKTYSPEFVRDITNVISGGRVLQSHEYQEELYESLPDVVSDSQGYFEYPSYNGRYSHTTENYEFALERTREHALNSHEKICEFIRSLDLSKAQGNTPIEKACGLIKLLGENPRMKNGNVNGESLPIFNNYERADKNAEELNNLNELIQSLDDAERELITCDMDDIYTDTETVESDMDDIDTDDEDEEIVGGSGHGSGLINIRIAEDMINGSKHWLDISRNLEGLTRFRLGKSNKFEPNVEGDDINKRLIKGFDEISKVPAIEYAYPESYRLFRIITQATPVRERVIREGKKQLIYMIIDCSVSMQNNNNIRIYKAGGVLFNRLKAVLKGEAELYFRFFDTKLFDEFKATTPEEAKTAMRIFKNKSFQGGGTYIIGCLRDSIERIKELIDTEELAEKPELVIVTDGDDYTGELHEDEFKSIGLRLHSFIVESKNEHLTQVARATGGVGVDKL